MGITAAVIRVACGLVISILVIPLEPYLTRMSRKIYIYRYSTKFQFSDSGSIFYREGDTEEAFRNRISVVWLKWRRASRVLCNRQIPMKLKGILKL